MRSWKALGEFALASALPAVAQQIDEAVQCQGLPYEDAHLQVAGMTPHEVTILVAQTYQFPEDLLLPLPAWESCSQWTDTDRRCGVVHFANACAANLFAPDSSLVLIQFANLMAQATQALGVPLTRIDSLLTESYLKAMELGASVDLDRTCFVLDGSTPDDKGRQSLLRTCAQLAAPA